MEMSFAQRTNIGYQYVVRLLSPASAYGRNLLKGLKPYSPEQSAQLQIELDNIGKTLKTRSGMEESFRKLEQILLQVKDIRSSIHNIRRAVLTEVELFEIKRFLLQLAQLYPLCQAIGDQARYDDISLLDTSGALDFMDPEKTGIPSFHISNRYSADLARIRKEKRAVEQRLRVEDNPDAKEALSSQRSVLAGEEQREEEQIRADLTRRLENYADDLQRNTETLGRLDLTLQKAKLAEQYHACRPETGSKGIRFVDMVNPQISDRLAAEGETFTPITLELCRGTTVLTGANMGGKSVALKTVALNVLLVHSGFYAFARHAEMPLFDHLFLVSEDLEAAERGLSSFGGEIVRLNEITAQLDVGRSLVLLDEFARGTNPDEGSAIAQAVATYLNKKDAVSVMTTHYDKVAGHAAAHYQVVGLKNADLEALSVQLETSPDSERVRLIGRCMDYGLFKVEDLQIVSRDAVNICKLLKCDKEIVDFAEEYY